MRRTKTDVGGDVGQLNLHRRQRRRNDYLSIYSSDHTDIDLSKVLGVTKILGWQKVVITDESIGVSQLLGARAQAALSQVYAYA